MSSIGLGSKLLVYLFRVLRVFSKIGEIPSTPLLVFDGSLSIALITSDSFIALNVKLCVQGVFRKALYVLFPVAGIVDASEGPMFVKKFVCNIFLFSKYFPHLL